MKTIVYASICLETVASWTQWGTCSCNTRTQSRTRGCEGGGSCEGPTTETRDCNPTGCAGQLHNKCRNMSWLDQGFYYLPPVDEGKNIFKSNYFQKLFRLCKTIKKTSLFYVL